MAKTHALNSRLARGKWYDFDTRLLHSVFDELVNFVEIELAWMCVLVSESDLKKYQLPWYHRFFHISLWRSPEAGIAYLRWAAELKYGENEIDKSRPNFGQPTFQALAAQEILALYHWWKEDRPNRIDPGNASGWSQYREENRQTAEAHGEDLLEGFVANAQADHLFNILNQIKKEQEEEDTAMLVRLVKIRQSLLT